VCIGCSEGGASSEPDGADGQEDAGLDADGADGQDAGPDGADGGDEGGPADVDLGRGFGLLVPDGARVCSLAGTWSAREAHRNQGRVALRPGAIVLPREAERLSADWIESVELGPEGELAFPRSEGEFVRHLQGTPENGVYTYEFVQGFQAGERALELAFGFAFEVRDDAPVDPWLVLDAQALRCDPWNPCDPWGGLACCQLRAPLMDPVYPNARELRFLTCAQEVFRRIDVRVGIAGRDELELTFRCPDHEMVIVNLGTVCPCALVAATFRRGAEQRTVEDFFRLAAVSYNHCNLSQEALVVLAEPLGEVAAVLVPGGPDSQSMGTLPTEVHYLNEDLEVLETLAVTGWATSP
jgi:hypothetical protein